MTGDTTDDANAPSNRSRPARIIIVDDHDIVRAGVTRLLSGEQDFHIIGQATNGREALELCRRVKPEMVLMDVRMPVMDGLAATRAIKQQLPRTSVLMLTQSPDHMLEALEAGASGYILKDAPRQQLVTAVRKALEGEVTLNRRIADQLLRRLASESRYGSEKSPPPSEPPPTLTRREFEVLNLLSQGQSNREICSTLGVSLGTVKNHVQHIIAKLEVSDRTQAVIRAFELNLVSPPRSDT